MAKKHTTAVILAAGSGTRCSGDKTKQRIELCGKTVLRRAVEAFAAAAVVDSIIVVAKADETDFVGQELSGIEKPVSIIVGGSTRSASAKAAAMSLPADYSGVIMIHDAARCLISVNDIEAVAAAAYEHGAATASMPVTDTVKMLDADGLVSSTVDRSILKIAATPQAFDFAAYKKAALECSVDDASVTDDNMLLELSGVKIFPVSTSKYNVKVTTAEDLEYARFLIERSIGNE
jgi:2-C-methyl-D-erythritol 4-phosphate cytidylyltransferase